MDDRRKRKIEYVTGILIWGSQGPSWEMGVSGSDKRLLNRAMGYILRSENS